MEWKNSVTEAGGPSGSFFLRIYSVDHTLQICRFLWLDVNKPWFELVFCTAAAGGHSLGDVKPGRHSSTNLRPDWSPWLRPWPSLGCIPFEGSRGDSSFFLPHLILGCSSFLRLQRQQQLTKPCPSEPPALFPASLFLINQPVSFRQSHLGGPA